MKEDIFTFRTPFLQEFQNRDTDENWKSEKNVNKHDTIEKRIPSQTSSTKKELPWISSSIDENVEKKHRLYKKSRNSTDPKTKETFQVLKKSVEKDIKYAKANYVNNHVIDGLHQRNTKPFFIF